MSQRERWMVAGLAFLAVCAAGAAVVGPVWLLWRLLDAPPAAREPAEYSDIQVTATGSWLLIRNTGPDAFFTGRIRYRVAGDDRATTWYEGEQVFIDWGAGEDIVISLPAPVPPGRVVQVTGTAQKEPAGPEYRLRYGPAAATPGTGLEDVGFDPDLAAATDARTDPKP
jgi:hypothetical protein